MSIDAVRIELPPVFRAIWGPERFKVFKGGRGSSKSHSIARYLVIKALQSRKRILCTREFQNSISDSVHRLISDIIEMYGLSAYFTIKQYAIVSASGSEFIFAGLSRNIDSIKSMEGIDICWVEEAHRVSRVSWDKLLPTIRKPDSEIIISYNPEFDTDPTHADFVTVRKPNSVVCDVNWRDNPWFPDVLNQERLHCKAHDYEKYLHVWEGHTRTFSDALIFKGKYVVESFDSPPEDGETVFRYGLDFGFGADPLAATRSFIKGDELFIDYEAYAYHLELRLIDGFLSNKIPGVKQWKVRADNSRPETINYLKHQEGGGFNIEAADKWPGSVEDGIEYLRSFRRIVIHPRCTNTIYEFGAYSYKVDRMTEDVLPVVVDAHNHGIDATRYAHDPLIQRKATIYDANVVT